MICKSCNEKFRTIDTPKDADKICRHCGFNNGKCESPIVKDLDSEIKKVAYKGEFNIKEKLSPEFDDLIKTLQFPDKFYDILDRVIKREIEENKEKIIDVVERIITRRYLTERKLGKGTGEFWEDLKQEIKNEVKG